MIAQPTSEQERAAHAGPDGAYLIAAGPGTGKTFTISERFAWLVQEVGVEAGNVLAVTFTERAAGELRDRIAGLLELPDQAWISTYHGACSRLLRDNAYLLGMPRDLRVLDDVGQRLMIERLQSRLRNGAEGEIDPDTLTALRPDDLTTLLRHGLQFVLKLKGRGIGPEEFRNRALELHREHHQEEGEELPAVAEQEAIGVLHAVYASYERRLRDEGLMDFDDLILATIKALQDVPEFQARCRAEFRYILVDEFQDSNRIQLELVRQLAAPGFANVAVVGDAKQSIYGWRDAEIENIRSRFPGTALPLTRNRRSRQEILDLATAFIRMDPEFENEPDLVADRGAGGAEAVTLVMAAGTELEARLVAAEICRLHEHGKPYSEIAVLAHSIRRLPVEFERELRRHGIPYVTSGGAGLFDREEVKDVLALLRLTDEPMDDGALVRVLQGPVVRLDDAAMYSLARRRIGRKGMRLRDCLEESRAEGSPELPPPVAGRASRVLGLVDRLGTQRDALTVADILNRLLEETGYLRHAQLRSAREGPRALLNLRKLFRMASQFERDSALAGLGDFVHQLDHLMEAEVPIGEAEAETPEAVSLLTVHAAKGLEFNTVFLVNTRPAQVRDLDRLFFDPDGLGFVMKYWRGEKHPHYLASSPSSAALQLARQERRRLVYVGLTRAADHLYVTASRSEASPQEVVAAEDDHFSELLTWALAHPGAARVVEAEQLPLVFREAEPSREPAPGELNRVKAVLERLRLLTSAGGLGDPPGRLAEERVRLSFSQLQTFELCPVRYRFSEAWQVPALPDELLPERARSRGGGGGLGAAVHAALEAWHGGEAADLLEAYEGPAEGLEMLRRYLSHPLAGATTLGVEYEFNLQLPTARVRGIVDRLCELDGGAVLVDYKTNHRLDERLRQAYFTQLRLYGAAAEKGLLPARDPRLVLFDLRRGEAIEVPPDAAAVTARVEAVAARISAGDYSLGPEHANRPCALCAYRPICKDAR